MWYFLYNGLLLIASPIILGILLVKKRCRRGLLERLGLSGSSGPSSLSGFSGSCGFSRLSGWLRTKEPHKPEKRDKPDQPNQPVIWVHAVSLGEAVAVVPLVQELRRRYPQDRLVVSTVTETGREAVEQRLKGVADHCYAPLDFPWVVRRVVRLLNPRLFVFVETELWPNLLRTLHRRGVPCVMINGRLSSRSFEGYRRIRPLMAQVLSHIRLFLMQSERDAMRIIALGADPARVVRVGNLKFDQTVGSGTSLIKDITRAGLDIRDQTPVLVAGSTHPGEEEQILDGYESILAHHPETVLVIAPRHIERASDLDVVVRGRGLAVQRRSEMTDGRSLPPAGAGRVVILDTRGELASVYRHATVAFVGGTLVPVGGHNLLEPALWGKPVLFGPYTDHCEELASLPLEAGAGARIRDGREFGGEAEQLIRDGKRREAMGRAASLVVTENRGALRRSVEFVQGILNSDRTEASQLVRA
ncbi:MAG: 3-deoxy-D-manno-octulosonic acid transferase [Nitrospirae bacterium]|nr:3-deoxy-D-manno-octulosonic acid transferase [Nitrospirota bacterium]